MIDILDSLRQQLRSSANEKTRASSARFFKEPVLSYGVTNPQVAKIAKTYSKAIAMLDKQVVWELCEELWKSRMMEEGVVACHWAYAIRNRVSLEDFGVFERWVSLYVSNWALCDTLCNHTVAAVVTAFPALIAQLKIWSRSESQWVRRASAVTLIIPARRGLFLPDIIEIADILLLDKEDLVQKGYGWMLKAASEAYEQAVFDYVMSKKLVMPRTALRYAIEKMPQELRVQAMAK